MAKILELQLQHQSFQWTFRVDFTLIASLKTLFSKTVTFWGPGDQNFNIWIGEGIQFRAFCCSATRWYGVQMAFFIQRVQTSCQGTQKLWKLLQKFIPRLRVPDWNRFAAPWLWCHAHFPVLCLSCDTLLWKRGDLRPGLSFFTSWLSKFCYGNRCMGGDNPGLAGQPILFYSSQFWMADSPSCTPPKYMNLQSGVHC